MKKIQLLLPVYNGQQYLNQCIDSILCQAYDDYELLIIDDCSIDNSKDIINTELLKKLKLINKNSQKLKILGTGEIKDKINIEADLISKSAQEKLVKVGGSVQLKNN